MKHASASRSRSWTPNRRPTPRINAASSGWGAPAAASWRRHVIHCPGTARACTIFVARDRLCRARRRRVHCQNFRRRDRAQFGVGRFRGSRSRNSVFGCPSSNFTWVPVWPARTRTARRRWWSGTARWCRCRSATTSPGGCCRKKFDFRENLRDLSQDFSCEDRFSSRFYKIIIYILLFLS